MAIISLAEEALAEIQKYRVLCPGINEKKKQ